VEIGCGAGYGTRLILEKFGAGQVDAVDLDPKMIGKAERRLRRDSVRVRLAVGDATDLQGVVRARRRTTPRACATRRE
jgi:ubiquinone/menaquinone biosynthesis C-methylase UbiE